MYTYVMYETERYDYVFDLAYSAFMGSTPLRLVRGTGWCGVRFSNGLNTQRRKPLTEASFDLVDSISCVWWEPFAYVYLGGPIGGGDIVVLSESDVSGLVRDEMEGVVEMLDVWPSRYPEVTVETA